MTAPVSERDRELAKQFVLDYNVRDIFRTHAAPIEELCDMLATARREQAEKDAALLKSVLDMCFGWSAGPKPPSWGVDLFDTCELKEDAYEAGYASGEWSAYRHIARFIQERMSSAAEREAT